MTTYPPPSGQYQKLDRAVAAAIPKPTSSTPPPPPAPPGGTVAIRAAAIRDAADQLRAVIDQAINAAGPNQGLDRVYGMDDAVRWLLAHADKIAGGAE